MKHTPFKDIHEQHILTCQFLYKTRKERKREIDLHETLPSAQEQFHLIQHLMNQVSQLTQEVAHLKQNSTIRKKKLIHEHLNSDAYPKPSMRFHQWMREIPTCFENIQRVFDGDLTDGVQHVIDTLIRQNSPLPICAFTQKSAFFYIYDVVDDGIVNIVDNSVDITDEDMTWRPMSHEEYIRLYGRISHKLVTEFLQWQTLHQDEINTNPRLKEKHFDYQCKISGIASAREDRRQAECKKWLFTRLATDFTHNTKIDYA